jgi:hypothetical protein
MGIIKNYHDKKWTLQFLDALYNSIDTAVIKKRIENHLLCIHTKRDIYYMQWIVLVFKL